MLRIAIRMQVRSCSGGRFDKQLELKKQQLEEHAKSVKATVSVRETLYKEAEEQFEKELSKFKGTREEQLAQYQADNEKNREKIERRTRIKTAIQDFLSSVFPIYLLIMIASAFFWSASFFSSMDNGPQYY
eukprot:TRINITY_DN5484_c0_g1_i2.p1 TRINITY_DN5484_c0_g1~~TRINITY_DN5484_c0_g1_i2.p1  ORF type:complete len:149 (+),score=28.35 TRINITY_DN5484_c0_g1_i2:57-449(+)